MDSTLLATKVRRPSPLHSVVRRGRLVETIERGITQHKLIMVSAPAGYGKTTLLSQWADTSENPVAWVSVGEEDNDAERFLRYLFLAWEKVHPGIRDSPLGLLLGGTSPDIGSVLSAFINVAGEVSDHTACVLDDFHLITDPSIHRALAFLLDHLPPTFHFVLAGRGDPPLPLARYRARHQLMELRTEDLQFQVEETADFLNRLMGLDLTREEVAPLHDRLEGWVAGIQLVGLTLRRHGKVGGGLVVSGRHRFVADYLREDVLSTLNEDSRRFLLHTSVLDRLCGSLCDAVTAGTGGQETLERLEKENMFIVPLDDSREWFRYHSLFAEVLREELSRRSPAEPAILHRRASRWYLAHDLPEPAFHHAVSGGDVDLVSDIAQRYVAAKLMRGEIKLVEGWLRSIPAEWHASHPELGLSQAAILFFTGQFEGCVHCLDDVERRLAAIGRGDVHAQRGRVTALRCFIACYHNELDQAERLAQQALQELPESDLGFRPGVYSSLGDTYRQNGRWAEARSWYLKSLEYSHAPVLRAESVGVYGAMADLALRQGRVREAAEYWRKALGTITDEAAWGGYPLPVIGWVYIRLGEILYEWNDLAGAREQLSRGLGPAQLGGDVRTLIAGYLLATRVKLAEADLAASQQYLDLARPLVEQAPFPDWPSRFERLQAELWLAQDRVRAAAGWVEERLGGQSSDARPGAETTQLTVARLLIAKGDPTSVERALSLLDGLRVAAEVEGRSGTVVEALALQAIAQWERGQRVAAMTSLERALRLAEPEGYVRLFADLGLPMARLLQESRSRNVMPDYVEKLLAAFSGVASPSADFRIGSLKALPEPLTSREHQVLGLMAAGLTNREIAEKLVVSPETVKKHTAAILAKLGVSTRTGAAARARELDLLR